MQSLIYRMVGNVHLKEQDGVIEIMGVSATSIRTALFKVWRTAKIADNMFMKLSGSAMKFPSFFAPDLLEMLEKVYTYPRIQINRPILKKIIECLKTQSWLNQTYKPTPSFFKRANLNKLKWTPLEHQAEFLDTYEEYTRKYNLLGYLMASPAGTGKTGSAIFLSEMLGTDVTIVISPKNAIDRVWRDTFAQIYKEVPKFWISSDNGEPTPGCRYYVFHYEALEAAVALAKTLKGKTNVVLDECHNFNDPDSLRTQLFVDLCKTARSPDTLWMSGTPIKAIGAEMIPLLRTIDPLFTPDVEQRFRGIFGLNASRALEILAARMGWISFKVEKATVVSNKIENFQLKVALPNAARYTLPEVRRVMGEYIIERMKYYEARLDFYKRIYFAGIEAYRDTLRSDIERRELDAYLAKTKDIHLHYRPDVHKEDVKYCNKFEKNKIMPMLHKPLREHFNDARSVYKYYDLKVQGEALGRILGKLRTECNVDIVKALTKATLVTVPSGDDPQVTEPQLDYSMFDVVTNGVNKTVFFTDFVEVVDIGAEMARKAGFFPLKVYGETNKDLNAIIQSFEKSVKFNPLFATYKSLSTAVPLIMADSVVFLNDPFRFHDFEQALSRLDRIGQKEVIKAYRVYLDTGDIPNISTRSSDIMAWSKSQVELIMGRKVVEDVALESVGLETMQTPPGWFVW